MTDLQTERVVPSQAPELLMPAGSMEKLVMAFAYGADAVYAGVPLFSLRARENEFSKEKVAEAITYAHARGKKIYLTMNILAHNNRVDRFLESFSYFADLNPDGFIMSDPGLIAACRERHPEAIIHLSTQANATNWATVKFWASLGVKRIVLSRELSLAEITEIHNKVPEVELEAFVHGSICIAYSGRCLISNYFNHRDANHGTCTNSCRWQYKLQKDEKSIVAVENRLAAPEEPYKPLEGDFYLSEFGQDKIVSDKNEQDKNKSVRRYEQRQQLPIDEDENGTYLMNSKDLCAIELLSEICAAGVESLKVEGRSKSEFYVAVVARAYRRAIDDLMAGRAFNPDNLLEVMSASSRTLMTGFLLRKPLQYGENYEDGASLPVTHQYLGQVVDFTPDKQIAWVSFKNRLLKGQKVEWMTPNDTFYSEANYIIRQNGDLADSAHGGTVLGLECPFVPDKMTMLRTPIPETNNLP